MSDMGTWGDLKTYVKSKLQYHGDSVIDLSTVTVGSSYDTRLQIILKNWEREVFALYTTNAALTVSTTSAEHDLSSASVCAKAIWMPRRVFVNGVEIPEYKSVIEMQRDWPPYPAQTSAAPNAWAQLDDSKIIFNRISNSAYSNSLVTGFYVHTTYTAESGAGGVADIPETTWEYFARYAAPHFQEGAVSSRGGLLALKRFDEQGYLAAMKVRGANMARYFNGMQRGGSDEVLRTY